MGVFTGGRFLFRRAVISTTKSRAHRNKAQRKGTKEFKSLKIPLSVQCSSGALLERRSSGRLIVPSAIVDHTPTARGPRERERERDLGEANNANYDREMEEIEEGK